MQRLAHSYTFVTLDALQSGYTSKKYR